MIDATEQRVDHTELVRDLHPTEDGHVRALRPVEQPAEHLDLFLEESTRDRRPSAREHQLGEGRDRGVLAMGGAERVVHVDVGELGEQAGEARIVRLLAGIESQVLEHRDVAGTETPDRIDRLGLVRHAEGPDRGPPGEQPRERVRDDPRAQVILRDAVRPAEVRRHHQCGSPRPELVDRWDRGDDPAVVRDRAVRERHVEIDPEEQPSPADVPQLVERAEATGRHRFDATISTRSMSRLE